MYGGFIKCEILFVFQGKVSNGSFSREISATYSRHLLPLNCPLGSEGQFRGWTCWCHVEIYRDKEPLDIFPQTKNNILTL